MYIFMLATLCFHWAHTSHLANVSNGTERQQPYLPNGNVWIRVRESLAFSESSRVGKGEGGAELTSPTKLFACSTSATRDCENLPQNARASTLKAESFLRASASGAAYLAPSYYCCPPLAAIGQVFVYVFTDFVGRAGRFVSKPKVIFGCPASLTSSAKPTLNRNAKEIKPSYIKQKPKTVGKVWGEQLI